MPRRLAAPVLLLLLAACEKPAPPVAARPTPAPDPAPAASPRLEPATANVAVDPATYPIALTPRVLDLGTIACGERRTGKVELHNTGDAPMVLSRCMTSCGCTTAQCPRETTIAPGERVEIEVTLDGGTVQRVLQKEVSFVFNDHEVLTGTVRAEAIEYVSMEPRRLAPERGTARRVVVRSRDDQPFRITSMSPEVIPTDALPAERAVEHELVIDWEAWWAVGGPSKLTFHLDHPSVTRLTAVVARPLVQPTPPGAPRFPLHDAARLGDLAAVTELLASPGIDLDATDRAGRTALMHAAQSKRADVVLALLDDGADVTIVDTIGTALSWAAGFGDPESVRLLLEAGAPLETTSGPTGFTALIWASGFGAAGSVEALLAAGADIHVRDTTQGMTPLMHAARTGTLEKVRLLLDAGADATAADRAGRTALDGARGRADAARDELAALLAEAIEAR